MRDRRAKGPGWRACRSGSATGSLALLLVACGGTDSTSSPAAAPGGSSDESPPGRFQRVICPQCVRAGGETSDFGDGSAYVPLGAGSIPVPTPCEMSTTVSSIELDAARALGFGPLLDRLEASFDVPLEWTASEPERPARGYSPSTRVRGTTRALSAQHLLPSLEGCTDSLLVRVATTLETDDGALSISGTQRSVLERGARRLVIVGGLDLSQARGTIELDPPPSSEALSGSVGTQLFAWPDGVRLSLSVAVAEARDAGGDTLGYHYEPLSARAPLDDCSVSARPIAFDEATPSIAEGQSLADRFPELIDFITAPQPLAASWMGGEQTSLDIDVGEPLALCDEAPELDGRVPYRVRSADGRVDIDSEAQMSLAFVDGALGAGWFEIYDVEAVQPAASFAERTGISGVDFGAYGGGRWHTELSFDPAAPHPLSGEVTVDAVDIDGSVTGIPTAIIDSIDHLAW